MPLVDRVPDPVREGEPVHVAVVLPIAVRDAVVLVVGVLLGLAPVDSVADAVGVLEGVRLDVTLGDDESERLMVTLGVAAADPVMEGVTDGVGDGVRVPLGVTEGVERAGESAMPLYTAALPPP